MIVLDGLLFIWETKKVVAGHIRQAVVLYSKDYTRICLSGLSIGHLRQVVVLQGWSFEQVWLQCFNLIQNNLVCLMEKWVQIFKCIISHSSTKSLVLLLHKFTIWNLDLFFSLFWDTKFASVLCTYWLVNILGGWKKTCPVGK